MANFAKIDYSGVVENVIVVSNDVIKDSNGDEVESIGIAFCQKLCNIGADTNWKQTSYNNNFRGNYAGIGMKYLTNQATLGVGSTDIFISDKPYASWVLSTTKAEYEPPSNPGAAPALTDDDVAAEKFYVWNESNYDADPATAWVLTTPPS